MNTLIPNTETDDGMKAVSGRALHDFLGTNRDYTNWFKDMTSYGLAAGGRPRQDHILTLEMAKELSMIQRTERGRQARAYFLECGKRAQVLLFDPNTLTRSDILQIALNAETERLALEQENRELSPKAEAYDDFLDATGKYGVGAVAKMLGTNQNKLFRDLRNAGVLISKGAMRNTPYQRYMHHFEVKAHSYERSNGEQGTPYTTYVEPSGIGFIRRKLGFESIDPPAPADAA
ncbi:phage antirepressor KilAC domain-containing protein [Corynebacterium sp.]|uniref:phage antirepressor KilAC domain-containing protein n=1 Tax=Corynebacterium sp. TaxID=1720 RepID=UPI003B3A0D05